MSTANAHDHIEELDLAIPDMNSENEELAVKATLEPLPGIVTVRIMQRGAFVRFRTQVIRQEEILTAIRQAHFRVSIFQDSTGRVGLSSQ